MLTTAYATTNGEVFHLRRKTMMSVTQQPLQAPPDQSNYVNSNDGYRKWLKESLQNFKKSP